MWTIVAILVVAMAGFAWLEHRDRTLKKANEQRFAQLEGLAPRPIATIEESAQLGVFGGACLVLLVIFLLIAGYAFNNATTILQQMQADGVAIMSILLFGLGMIMSRRRTYTVYRLPRPRAVPPPPIPAETEKPLSLLAKLRP